MKVFSPFTRTQGTRLDLSLDLTIALLPVLIWSVFLFGARVITLCAVSVASCFLFDFLVLRFLIKQEVRYCFNSINTPIGLMCAFIMPVSVPMWVPLLGGMIAVFARHFRPFRRKQLFHPVMLAAGMLNLCCSDVMTVFTRPFAYFNAFSPTLDPVLVNNYRVISPLMYMADGSVYEDGVIAQIYGFASGCMGEVAVAAIALGCAYLVFRKRLPLYGALGYLGVIAIAAALFPSADAETNYYVFSVLLSGGTVFIAAFSLADGNTTPVSSAGKLLFGILAGIISFLLRGVLSGQEGGYYAVLILNLCTPIIDRLLPVRPVGEKNNKKKAF